MSHGYNQRKKAKRRAKDQADPERIRLRKKIRFGLKEDGLLIKLPAWMMVGLGTNRRDTQKCAYHARIRGWMKRSRIVSTFHVLTSDS